PRHVADPLPQGTEVAHRVEPNHCRATGIRDEQRDQDPKERRLAAAIGTDEAKQLPWLHLERHLVERERRPESLAERFCANGVRTPQNCTSTGMPIVRMPLSLR